VVLLTRRTPPLSSWHWSRAGSRGGVRLWPLYGPAWLMSKRTRRLVTRSRCLGRRARAAVGGCSVGGATGVSCVSGWRLGCGSPGSVVGLVPPATPWSQRSAWSVGRLDQVEVVGPALAAGVAGGSDRVVAREIDVPATTVRGWRRRHRDRDRDRDARGGRGGGPGWGGSMVVGWAIRGKTRLVALARHPSGLGTGLPRTVSNAYGRRLPREWQPRT